MQLTRAGLTSPGAFAPALTIAVVFTFVTALALTVSFPMAFVVAIVGEDVAARVATAAVAFSFAGFMVIALAQTAIASVFALSFAFRADARGRCPERKQPRGGKRSQSEEHFQAARHGKFLSISDRANHSPDPEDEITVGLIPEITMLLQIANVIDPALIAAIRDAAAADGFWSDGKGTAKGRAKAAKNNQQALASGAAKGVLDTLSKAIIENETVRSAAQPAAIARIMLNRYGEGMEYGAHVDASYIDGVRTDLSFTLFLNGPEDYDGGELVIDSAGAEDSVKLTAGSLALYPSTSLHRVDRVTRGARIACIGWIKSRIRSQEDRNVLFDLDRVGADLTALGAPGEIRDRLANVRNNLLRRWGE